MITIKADNKTVELYNSIKELPVFRYKAMQSYLLQDSGIGDTIGAIDIRLASLIALLEHKRHDEATEEVKNLRLSFFSALTGMGFKSKAFACMVYSVDGQKVINLSDDGIEAIVAILEELPTADAEAHWESVKKKLIPNYESISPDGSEMTSSTLTV